MTNIEVNETENEGAVDLEGTVDLDSTDRTPVHREFPVEITADGDGRTLELQIVPYGIQAMVIDKPDHKPYPEVWLPGAFERQTTAANRVKVLVNIEHETGFDGTVGHGITLEDHAEGLRGTFRIHNKPIGDTALELIRDGVLDGVSLEAIPLTSRRVGGVVERVRAHLDKVALCRYPAFEQAKVLAVREAPIVEVPLEPVAMPDEMAERLAGLGVELLRRVTVVRKPWDGEADRFTDEEYQRSCLIDRGGDDPVKERCSLPVLEPNGDLNANSLNAAAKRVVNVRPEQKAPAAQKLIRFYRLAEIEPPESLRRLASA